MPIVKPTEDAVREAARLLRDGRLVAFPTETVYGLGADATQARAVASIFAAKGRPRFNPLIVHVADANGAGRIVRLSRVAEELAVAFWPGPLTLVAPRRADSGLADLVSAGLATTAVRVPAHPIARALIAEASVPVAAPSANRSGHVSATTAQHVAADLGDAVAMILDGGACEHGLESTVLDVSGETVVLLRPGAVPAEAIEEVMGVPLLRSAGEAGRPTSPGQLAAHYAPRAAVRLDASAPRTGEALIAFGPDVPAHDGPCFNLSVEGDLIEAAANLFAALRMLDDLGVAAIAVMPIPMHGLGEAINDRLRRAALGRTTGPGPHSPSL